VWCKCTNTFKSAYLHSRTVLHQAATAGQAAIVQQLVKTFKGTHDELISWINQRNNAHETALFLASGEGHLVRFDFLSLFDLTMLTVLPYSLGCSQDPSRSWCGCKSCKLLWRNTTLLRRVLGASCRCGLYAQWGTDHSSLMSDLDVSSSDTVSSWKTLLY
jgi:hypothetical protein